MVSNGAFFERSFNLPGRDIVLQEAPKERLIHGVLETLGGAVVRIGSGELKGKRLKVTPGRKLRPTSSKVKEAMFDLMDRGLEGARVLDLFSGSGALGIEALSRGATSVCFVDIDPLTLKLLRENLRVCGLEGRAVTSRSDVIRFLRKGNKAEPFHVIFADPPYAKGMARACLREVTKGGWLGEDGLLIIEHSRWEVLESNEGDLVLLKRRRYGDTMVSIYGPIVELKSVEREGACCDDGDGVGQKRAS